MSSGSPPPLPPSGPANAADWLEACRRGDPHAEETLFRAYSDRLFRLIRRRLSLRLSRRFDPEDIVLSAWRSFFLRARAGEFKTSGPDGDLWPLLVTLAVRKLSKHARRHQSAARDVDRDLPIETAPQPLATEEEPEAAVLIADEIENLLARLDTTDQEILIQTLQGADAAAVAADLGCSDRTVRRSLDRIRRLAASLEDPDASQPAIRNTGNREKCAETDVGGLRPSHLESDVTLLRLAGKGAFTKVYRGIDRITGETVAIKFLRRESWRERRNVTSLLAEYEILRSLRHPGIVGARGWGQTRGGGTFLVLEWTEGTDLSNWAGEGHTLQETIGILQGIAEALSVAHAHGIIHGDLKPENILRRAGGRTVLADFGLAWRSGRLANPASIGGTTGYLAPELLAGATPTIQTDIYSFGVLARNLMPEESHQTTAPPGPALEKLQRLIDACSESNPQSRPARMDDILRELARDDGLTERQALHG